MAMQESTRRIRCSWATDELSIIYHDSEWGIPVHDDRLLFEFLILEGAQAGLSWLTILRKRQNYRKAFATFDPLRVSAFDAGKIRELLSDPGIIRNRRKIEAAIVNARAFLDIQREFGSFDAYLWRFVGGTAITNRWRTLSEIPATTREAEILSRDLKDHGFKFVGPTICYAFMQAVGLVNDHLVDCFRHEQIAKGL